MSFILGLHVTANREISRCQSFASRLVQCLEELGAMDSIVESLESSRDALLDTTR